MAWSPENIDGRGYDYAALAKYADQGKADCVSECHSVSVAVFVMSYDEQSQMWGGGRCEARPNSPLIQTFSGVRKYLQLGVPPTKLILGLPWYGYRYPCLGKALFSPLPSLPLLPRPRLELSSGVCYIAEVPFRGCNCTDAAGREFAYKDVMEMLGKTGQ